LHLDQRHPLGRRNGRQREFGTANREIQVVQKRLILWQGGTYGKKGHGGKRTGPAEPVRLMSLAETAQLRAGKTPCIETIQFSPR